MARDTTIQEAVQRAMRDNGDKPEDLDCYYQDAHGEAYHYVDEEAPPATLRTSFQGLPTRRYNDGYGGVNGPPFIAFSQKYVYISVQYDGSEHIEAIPRHPEFLGKRLPWPGG